MKKSLSFFCLLLCLPLFLCGFFFLFSVNENSAVAVNENTTASADEGETRTFTSVTDFIKYISDYSSINQNDTIILDADMDFSNANGLYPSRTIGTADAPFCGTFDGNGHTISNVFMDLSGNTTSTLYAGIFGYTNGATIKNLRISGTYTVRINPPTYTYMGMLAGSIENTTIENCYITAVPTINFNGSTTGNYSYKMLNYGAIAGSAESSTIRNCIVNNSSSSTPMTTISLDVNYRTNAKIGGLVGNLSNSTILFAITSQVINVEVLSSYSGTCYVGGIFGYVSGSSSQVVNCVTENTLNVTDDRSVANVGIIGGYISTPAPRNYNLSYCYYYSDGTFTYETFGNKGNYALSDSEANMTAATTYCTNQSYFDTKNWHSLLGDHWDFRNVWYSSGGQVLLQAFGGTMSVVAQVSNSDALEIDSNDSAGGTYRYEDEVTFSFRFRQTGEDADTIFSRYYTLSTLTIGSTTAASFSRVETDDGYYYALNPYDNYSRLSMTTSDPDVSGNVTYTITISGITRNYAGTYRVNLEPEKFVGRFEYRLYDHNSDETSGEGYVLVPEEIKTECYVYYLDGDNETREVERTDLKYGDQYTISTESRNDSVYVFEGWYLVSEDGEDTKLSSSQNLSFIFGQELDGVELNDDFQVYARYVSDACVITFLFDDGMESILLSNGREINESGESISIVKESTQLRITFVMKPNYTFDTDRFIQTLNTYLADQGASGLDNFCVLDETMSTVDEESGESTYVFVLDLNMLNTADFINGFTLDFTTEAVDVFDMNIVWIIVGSVGGAIVLAGIIVLIVVLVRRRGGGGGSVNKSAFKNMYY